jgi:Acyl-CoA carboxylase epsilon subunit
VAGVTVTAAGGKAETTVEAVHTDADAGMDTGAGTDTGSGGAESTPVATMSVVRGQPTPEEVAALVAVIAGRAASAIESGRRAASAPTSGWTDRSRYVRGQLSHSPDGWRASAMPR